MKDTHPQVKFDVFERLNSGAVQLKPQELRHGLYHGSLMSLISKLARDKVWSNLFSLKSDKRMRLEEHVLRFLAFSQDMDHHEKPLTAFLNKFAEKHKDIDWDKQQVFERLFREMTENTNKVFGEYAFKIFYEQFEIKSAFNAALFDAETIAVFNLRDKLGAATGFDQRAFLNKLPELFKRDDFFAAISRATSDEKSVRIRIEQMTDLLRASL